jgi:dTDP-4-dehydrorhamnose reductase
VKPLAWITGVRGLLGNRFLQTAPNLAREWRAEGLSRETLDLLDFAAVRRAFAARRPQLVIHCAAMTKTPDCQAHPKLAYRTNVEATQLLAELAAEIPFVLFSTDLVFDGRAAPYHEVSPLSPLSYYGETKIAAEQIVLANPKHLVVRTSLNYGISPTGDRAPNEQLRRAWQRGEETRLFTDEFRCPIPCAVTVRAVWELIRGKRTGLFHVAGCERLSRYEVGKLLAARNPHLNPRIAAASAKEYPDPPRPADTTMNCDKAQAVLSFPLPKFSEWLNAHPGELI